MMLYASNANMSRAQRRWAYAHRPLVSGPFGATRLARPTEQNSIRDGDGTAATSFTLRRPPRLRAVGEQQETRC